MKILTTNFKHIQRHRQWLFWACASLLFFFSALYVYFVNTAILHGVALREAAAEREALSGSVSQLEEVYLSLKSRLTLSFAYRQGFEEARGVRFVTQKTLGILPHNDL